MKETEKMERVRKELALLTRRVERLNDEINNAVPDLVVKMEINLCLEAIMNLKKEYDYLEEMENE